MAKKKPVKKKKVNAANGGGGGADGGGLLVDPARVRFQHARIRPIFSGCGRSVQGTLEDIRQGKTKPEDLPPIQVLVGPIDEVTGEPWYFSLNNRRLWVLKRCREEGLLFKSDKHANNKIYVRVRKPKSEQEKERYSVQNCALEAKIVPERPKQPKANDAQDIDHKRPSTSEAPLEETIGTVIGELAVLSTDNNASGDEGEDDSDSDSSDDDAPKGPTNRFSALF